MEKNEGYIAKDVRRMLDDIDMEVRYTRELIGRDAFSARVMGAMASVPRHLFVPDALSFDAYANGPLPIGHGQTISQPYIVALMTELLDVGKDSIVLEIGTGSGYQAAVLSLLVRRVYSVELISVLGDAAKSRLSQLGYDNVEIRVGDGHLGWPEHAPYDGIIVTAAASHIPPPLIEQLKPGARLILPVGHEYFGQELLLVSKDERGHVTSRSILPVAFVPLRSPPELSDVPRR